MDSAQVNIKDIQNRLLEGLKWYHAFCMTHHLRYYVLGGTLLGAVRHSGFIPWDDDVDVGMPRSDFEAFLNLMRQESGRYVAESYQNQRDDFIYPYGKLYDTATTLVERTRHPVRRGLYLDVFPLDGIGSTEEDARSNYRKINFLNNLLSVRVCALNPKRSFFKNAAIVVGRLIPDGLLPTHRIVDNIVSACKNREFETSAYVGNLVGNWNFRELVPRSVVGEPVLYPFEDTQVYGIQDYDAYLTHIYGDWRRLPPEEKQQSHHTYLECDLNKSYL